MGFIIVCRTLSAPCSSGYRHVATVGYTVGGGHRQYTTRQGMIDAIKAGNSVVTQAPNGWQAKVEVHTCACGHEYLETVADATKTDNLRELPNC